MQGARIGVPRAFFYDKVTPPGAKEPRGGLSEDQARVMAEAITVLKQQGAVVVDPADIPSVVATEASDNFLSFGVCSGLDNAKGKDADCSVVFKYGMKRDFDTWLATLGPKAPVTTLTELRQWNVAHQKAGAIKYGQALLDISDEMDVRDDRARYQADREKDLRLAAAQGIDAAMKEHHLDALLFPAGSGAGIAAKPGYPTVIVPFALVPNVPFAERQPARAGVPAGLRRQARSLRRQLHGPGLQRAAADRAGLRLRASHEAARSSWLDSLAPVGGGRPAAQAIGRSSLTGGNEVAACMRSGAGFSPRAKRRLTTSIAAAATRGRTTVARSRPCWTIF